MGIYNQKFYGSFTSDGERILEQNCLLNEYEKFDNGPIVYKTIYSYLRTQYIELLTQTS